MIYEIIFIIGCWFIAFVICMLFLRFLYGKHEDYEEENEM